MKTSDFDYHLPEELIANYPLDSRSSSRLLIYSDKVEHKNFSNILDYLNIDDLLIVNNTSVIPARIFGTKDSGGAVEIMLERIMEGNKALVQMRSSRSIKIGALINLDSYQVKCIDRQNNFYILQFGTSPLEVFNAIGHVPLPPYIKRDDQVLDKERYATVYEDKELQESVAAPTAGLHFDDTILPKRKTAWSSWNYLLDARKEDPVALTYNMNILQGLKGETQYCVSLNSESTINPSLIIKQMEYRNKTYQKRKTRSPTGNS